MTREDLQALLSLQKKDLTLLQLKKESQAIPERRAEIEQRADAARAAEQAAKERIWECEAAIRQAELEVEALRAQVGKYKTQQMQAKSNDEYKAFVHEIATAESKVGEAEDRELEQMTLLDDLKAALSTATADRREAEDRVAGEVGDLEARLEVIRSTFEELKVDRGPIVSRLPRDILDQYMALLAKKQDSVLVPVKQSACGGCHMQLTPQTLHDAHSLQKWTNCSYCGRLLYDPDAV